MSSSERIFPALEPAAQERLFVLIATLVNFPGIGCPEDLDRTDHHDALQAVALQMQVYARSIGLSLPAYSSHTLRKDLLLLRRYGILDDRMYRWGYYLGTGAMAKPELGLALQALASQAQMQGDPRIQSLYAQLEQRLRGLNLSLGGELLYPVRTQLDRSIVPTNPEEMRRKGRYKGTLFARLRELEGAIGAGRAIELYRASSPYQSSRVGHEQVYPLQLIYADIAWYLLSENVSDGHLAISRVDRFTDYWRELGLGDRGLSAQQLSLGSAHGLLRAGWGLALGNAEEQRLERSGQLEFVEVQVRFYGAVVPFILEGESRHPKQRLRNRRKDELGRIVQVDYCVPLPRRSWFEFSRWVRSFGASARVVAPVELVGEFEGMVRELGRSYGVLGDFCAEG
jgi:WYL domain